MMLNLPNRSQLDAQLVGCAKQGVLDRAFAGIQNSGDGPQSQAVVMLQFEHDSLAR